MTERAQPRRLELPRKWDTHPRVLECGAGHKFYSVRETRMVLELSGLTGLAFLECYRCQPATLMIVHLTRAEGDDRAYYHAVPTKDAFEQLRGMRSSGSTIGQCLAFLVDAWAKFDEQ